MKSALAVVAEQPARGCPQQQGNHHAQRAGPRGDLTRAAQLVDLDLQPGNEHQKDHTQLGQFQHRLFQMWRGEDGQMDQVQQRRAEEQSSKELAEDGRLAEARAEQPRQLCDPNHEHEHQHQLEKIRHRHLLAGARPFAARSVVRRCTGITPVCR